MQSELEVLKKELLLARQERDDALRALHHVTNYGNHWPSVEHRELYHSMFHALDDCCEDVSADSVTMTHEGVKRMTDALDAFEAKYPKLTHGEQGWDYVNTYLPPRIEG